MADAGQIIGTQLSLIEKDFAALDSWGYGCLHRSGLLHDLLEHKVLVSTFLCRLNVPGDAADSLLNRLSCRIKYPLFAEFEREAHDMYMKGQPLTAQTLNALYRRLNELYYDGATVNELQDIEWARIPHFYNSFYVYQYATGFSSAVAIATRIFETGDASSYLEFLKTGGSDYPLEELKIAGVDLTKPDTVNDAMKAFADALEEFESLIKEL